MSSKPIYKEIVEYCKMYLSRHGQLWEYSANLWIPLELWIGTWRERRKKYAWPWYIRIWKYISHAIWEEFDKVVLSFINILLLPKSFQYLEAVSASYPGRGTILKAILSLGYSHLLRIWARDRETRFPCSRAMSIMKAEIRTMGCTGSQVAEAPLCSLTNLLFYMCVSYMWGFLKNEAQGRDPSFLGLRAVLALSSALR